MSEAEVIGALINSHSKLNSTFETVAMLKRKYSLESILGGLEFCTLGNKQAIIHVFNGDLSHMPFVEELSEETNQDIVNSILGV